jgi:hypothetical protein
MPIPKGTACVGTQKISDAQFIADFPILGAGGMSKKYGVLPRAIGSRRRRIEMREGIYLAPPKSGGRLHELDKHPAAIKLGIENGHILVGSDSHYWPGIVTTAHKAFLEFCKEFKPKVVIKNGDEMDFPAISRYAPIGWESRPKVWEEVENTKAMLSEIEKVSPKARHIWPCGNHDGRFETRLATLAPEYAKIEGVHLKDHFPSWEPCWAVLLNEDVVIKHRIKGGIHAARNNTLAAGRSTVTGHLHALKVSPHSDYNGTRWGVDCGTMAEPYGPQFYNYTELNPMDWRSGFVLLTLVNGKLLWPEVVWVSGPNTVQFRGKEWTV